MVCIAYAYLSFYRDGGYSALWLCIGGPYLHEQLAKKPGQSVWDHIRHVRWVLARYQEDVPHSCLRVEDNRVIFLLLTLRGDPV